MNSIFPLITSYEEFEKFKSNMEILDEAAREIIRRHHLPEASLSLFQEGTNIVFAYGQDRVIKIFPPIHRGHFKSELLVLRHLQGKLSIHTPTVEYYGEIDGWPYIVMSQLEGTLLETLWENLDHDNKTIILQELGSLIREVHSLPTQGLEEIDCHWNQFIDKQIKGCVEQHRSMNMPESLLQQLPYYLESAKEHLPQFKSPVILTGEYTPMNFLVKQTSGVWHIYGLIDFGDAMLGLPEYDLLGPGAFLIQGDKQLLRKFLIAYGYSTDAMTPALSRQLTVLMLLHQYSNLNVQIRIKGWQDKVQNMQDLENLVWGLSDEASYITRTIQNVASGR